MMNWFGKNKAQGSELEEQEMLLRELYRQMVRVAYSRVRNKSDADDVVQEAWMRMLIKQDSLREENKLAAWAKTITANVAHNINRLYTGNRATCELCEAQEECAGSSTSSSQADLMLEISELLGALDPRSRTMLLYKFYYGFKDQEIADAFNVPVGTVKARIHRSKERLRKQAIVTTE